MSKNTGMLAFVYRSGPDCTNNGVSSKHAQVVILGMDGPFEPSEKSPALKLVRRNISGIGEYYHLEPLGPDGVHYMFGGNFAYTSDSRFSKISRYPLPIHDRTETRANQYMG